MLAVFGVLWGRQSRVEAEVARRNEAQAVIAAEFTAVRRELGMLRKRMEETNDLARRERAEIRAAVERLRWR